MCRLYDLSLPHVTGCIRGYEACLISSSGVVLALPSALISTCTRLVPLSRGFSSRVRVGSGHRRGLAYLWKASSYFLDKFPYMLRVLLGRLQLPCPCLACLFVSFRSVCFRAPQASCVWWEPFFGLAQIFGLPALSAQSCSVGFAGSGPSSGTCGLFRVSARALEHPCSFFPLGRPYDTKLLNVSCFVPNSLRVLRILEDFFPPPGLVAPVPGEGRSVPLSLRICRLWTV